MPEPRRAAEKDQRCDVKDCSASAERSVSGKNAGKAGLTLESDDLRKARLCREHYKQFRKKTKKDRELERLGW